MKMIYFLIISVFIHTGPARAVSVTSATAASPSKKEKILFNPLPVMERFWLNLHNQKLVIQSGGKSYFINQTYPRTLSLTSPSLFSHAAEGVKFGTFLDHKTLLYLKAGFESKRVFSVGRSAWDTTLTPSLHGQGHAVTPGVGVEWTKGPFSISGEYQTAFSPYASWQNIKLPDKKNNQSLMLMARYKLGRELSRKKSSR